MAYMDQEKKKEIAKLLKAFMPKDWKYTLSVSNYSRINFNLKSAPVDFVGMHNKKLCKNLEHANLIRFDFPEATKAIGELLKKINTALNLNNYDNTDYHRDYVDVGHYVSINIGQWDKPFIYTGK